MRKWRGLWVLVFALSLVAAACGGDGDGNGDDETPGGDTGVETTDEGGTDAETLCSEDEFGCVEVAEGDPIKLGTLLVISGANAALGTDSQRGAEIAAAERGDVLGHEIEWNHQDDLCSSEGGQAGGQALASDPEIVAVVGTSCSSSAYGVADTILSEAGIPLISPSNTGPGLTAEETHQPFYLRTAHNDKIQGAIVAEFAYSELGKTTAATIHDGSPYAEQLQQVFADKFTELGGTITKQEAVQSGDTDMKPVLTDIAADSPEVLYYPIFVAEGALITSQSKEVEGLGDATSLIASDGVISPDFFTAAGDAAEGMHISGPDVSVGGDAYADFAATYEEEYGEEPISAFHAHAYDATNIILDSIEEVAIEEEGSLFIPRTALRDAMFATSGFEGITGTLECNELGDCQPSATIAVNVVEGGDLGEVVFTKELTLEEAGG